MPVSAPKTKTKTNFGRSLKVIQEAKIKNVQNRGDLGWLGLPKVFSLSSLFSTGQTAIKLFGAEAADRAQCAAPDKPIGY